MAKTVWRVAQRAVLWRLGDAVAMLEEINRHIDGGLQPPMEAPLSVQQGGADDGWRARRNLSIVPFRGTGL